MISVDIFADAIGLDDTDRGRVDRAIGAASTLARLARGKAVSGPLVFIDAAISVLDAVEAYAKNRQAKEATRQLEIEVDMLEQMLVELLKRQEYQRTVERARQGQKLMALRNAIDEELHRLSMSDDEFFRLASQTKKIGALVSVQRLSAPPNSVFLLKLEDAYYRLFDGVLASAANRLGG